MSTVARPFDGVFCSDQLWLFDPGIDLAAAREGVDDLMSAAQSENTKKAYAHSWRVFGSWCEDAGRAPLPATPETLRLFVSWCLRSRGYRLETVRTHLAAVKDRHLRRRLACPVDESVRVLMRSAARRLRERPAGAAALEPDLLRRLCVACLADGSAVALRDRAILLLGFAGAFRRSEVAAMSLDDVRFVPKGLEVALWRTKTDQEGGGRFVGLFRGDLEATCPVRALRAWLRLRGSAPGPLFLRVGHTGVVGTCGLSGEAVNKSLKRWLRVLGVDDAGLSAHSLRAGFVTAAGVRGASALAIMKRTGHKTVQMVQRYLRPVEVFAGGNPLADVL